MSRGRKLALVAVIDAVLTAICELGVDDLRKVLEILTPAFSGESLHTVKSEE